MSKLYLAFVDTPGLFAGIIRKVLKQKYVHVAISLDPYLEEAYSIGRRDPKVPIIAGFERENKHKILKAFPEADYMICSIECTPEQKRDIQKTLEGAYNKRFFYHYAIIGLPFILMQKAFHQGAHYTCSSYIAKILSDEGILFWNKDYSCVTPKDFFLRTDKEILFEGKLKEICALDQKSDVKGKLRDKTYGEIIYGQ